MKTKLHLMLIVSFLFLVGQVVSQDENLKRFKDRRAKTVLAKMNKKTGTAERIYGLSLATEIIDVDHRMLDEKNIRQVGKALFSDYDEILKISDDNLSLKKIESDGQWNFVEYQQFYSGVPVYGSSIGFSIDPNGKVVSLGALAHPTIAIATIPAVSSNDALASTKRLINSADANAVHDPELIILPGWTRGLLDRPVLRA